MFTVIECEEYSDRHILAIVEGNINEDEMEQYIREYKETFPEGDGEYAGKVSWNQGDFVEWALSTGRLVGVDYTYIHVGSYSALEVT